LWAQCSRPRETIPFPRAASAPSFPGNRELFRFRLSLFLHFMKYFELANLFPPSACCFSPLFSSHSTPTETTTARGRFPLRGVCGVDISCTQPSARVNLIHRSQVSIWNLLERLIFQIWLDAVVAGGFFFSGEVCSTANPLDLCSSLWRFVHFVLRFVGGFLLRRGFCCMCSSKYWPGSTCCHSFMFTVDIVTPHFSEPAFFL
jgi:hypothetical protein